MRKIFSIALVLLVLLSNSVIASANERPISVSLDGVTLRFDVPPQTINGRVMVPIRTIFEGLGLEVGWDPSTKKITGRKDELVIETWVDKKEAFINGKKILLDVSPTVKSGRTLVPVRFIAEATGAEVVWNDRFKEVQIKTQDYLAIGKEYPSSRYIHTQNLFTTYYFSGIQGEMPGLHKLKHRETAIESYITDYRIVSMVWYNDKMFYYAIDKETFEGGIYEIDFSKNLYRKLVLDGDMFITKLVVKDDKIFFNGYHEFNIEYYDILNHTVGVHLVTNGMIRSFEMLGNDVYVMEVNENTGFYDLVKYDALGNGKVLANSVYNMQVVGNYFYYSSLQSGGFKLYKYDPKKDVSIEFLDGVRSFHIHGNTVFYENSNDLNIHKSGVKQGKIYAYWSNHNKLMSFESIFGEVIYSDVHYIYYLEYDNDGVSDGLYLKRYNRITKEDIKIIGN